VFTAFVNARETMGVKTWAKCLGTCDFPHWIQPGLDLRG
jgi:hypothetical protein